MTTDLTTAPPMPTNMDPTKLAKLARELVMNIRPKAAVLDDFAITEAQLATLVEFPMFKRLYEQLAMEWNSVASTEERIRFKAAAALEDGLAVLATRMVDEKEALPAANETAKVLARLANIGEKEAGTRTGEKFTINISVAGKTLTFEKEVEPTVIEHNDLEALPAPKDPK